MAFDEKEYVWVTYPKFKMGEEVVMLMKSGKEIIKKYASRTPEPLNQQFSERLSKEEAIKAYNAKKAMKKTALFPLESEQTSQQADGNSQPSSSQSTSRHTHQKQEAISLSQEEKWQIK
ncbi:hypothetical protein pdam_00023459 [Pocillopora damicornis]|uniref:Uncharacterized protein n=1 Tax=Pocillopora damicornis TaxID=46731 RepID=A0A3M6TWY1_POCDA|nr:hypothetical protein pdam_00023459 [Pocillopora damicornis]